MHLNDFKDKPSSDKSVTKSILLPSLCTINARSLKNKIDELKVFLRTKPVNVACLTETWLDDSVENKEVSFSHFITHRADRSGDKKGGGLCCLVDDSFRSLTISKVTNDEDFELLLVKIAYKTLHCLIATLYFPHGSTLNREKSRSACNRVTAVIDDALNRFSNCPVFLIGDFNRLDVTFFENNFCSKNVITRPTRKNAVLDLILIPDEFVTFYLPCDTLPPLGASDHDIVLVHPEKDLISEDTYVKVWDFRRSNMNRVSDFLSTINWEDTFSDCNLDDMYHLFLKELYASLNLLPYSYVKRSSKDPPWMTSVIKVLVNKRYLAYRSKNWSLYNHFKTKVKVAIREAKRNWGNRLIKDGQSVWDIYKRVRGDYDTSSDWLLNCEQKKSAPQIVEMVKNTIASNFAAKTQKEQKLFPFIVPFQFGEEEISISLKHVNPRKSPGPDRIPTLVWSKLADFIAKPLTIIFNTCLQYADLPQEWKEADVIPLPKSTPPSISEVRPISLLPIPERIFEKCLLKRIKPDFLSRFDSKQFAYRPKSSTVCALIELENFLTSSLQDPSVLACHIVCVDLRKGFDRIPHDLLIKKMFKDNFGCFLVSFVQNYLSNRKMRIRWGATTSTYSNVKSGVPQGSSLGPLIFGYFVSDLTCVEEDAMMVKYADDIFFATKIFKYSNNSMAAKIYEDILTWSTENEMSVNEDKCQQMFVTAKSQADKKFGIPTIPLKDNVKILGVVFDENIRWKLHVNNISKKASSRLFALRQLRDFLPKKHLITVYQNCVRSILEYAAPLCRSMKRSSEIDIERIQHRAHIIVCGLHCKCSDFVPLSYRRTILSYKLFLALISDPNHPLHHLTPPVMSYSKSFRLPVIKSALRNNSFLVAMSKMFNAGFHL